MTDTKEQEMRDLLEKIDTISKMVTEVERGIMKCASVDYDSIDAVDSHIEGALDALANALDALANALEWEKLRMAKEKSCFNCRYAQYRYITSQPTCINTSESIFTKRGCRCKKWEGREKR